MRKKYILIGLSVLVIIIGIICGILINKLNNNSKGELESKLKVASDTELENQSSAIITSTSEIKTSPNCKFIFRTYYIDCKHTTEEIIEIPKRCVNETEEELQIEYKDWKIKEFNPYEVTFFKELEGICDNHFIIRENNGYISIYTLDSDENEVLKETTQIAIYYLPETDKLRLKEGIKVNSKEELNSVIEDYE